VRAARTERGLHASCAILSNHESPLRDTTFVTRKITAAAAEIALGRRDSVTLGNLDVRRDWGFAGDHVGAMRLLARAAEPLDVPIGTGVGHALADLVAEAFAAAGVDDPARHVVHDPALVRPADAAVSVADPEPARRLLGWQATTSFEDVVRHMVAVDLERLRSGVDQRLDYLYPGPRRA
jgi:GDPmannose 4,6-dehydratase